MRLVSCVFVLGWCAGVAHADVYPLEDVDRPLLLNPGMTALDVAAEVEAYVAASDPITGRATSFSRDTTSDLSLAHQFGPVLIVVEAYKRDLAGTVLVRTTKGGALFIGADTFADTQTVTSEHALRGGYNYKLVGVPHRLAVYANVGLQLYLFHFATDTMLPATAVHDLTAFASASGELQLTQRLAVSLGTSFGVPLAYSPGLDELPGASVFASGVFTFRRFDIYANVGLENLSNIVLPFGALGFEVRWGM